MILFVDFLPRSEIAFREERSRLEREREEGAGKCILAEYWTYWEYSHNHIINIFISSGVRNKDATPLHPYRGLPANAYS